MIIRDGVRRSRRAKWWDRITIGTLGMKSSSLLVLLGIPFMVLGIFLLGLSVGRLSLPPSQASSVRLERHMQGDGSRAPVQLDNGRGLPMKPDSSVAVVMFMQICHSNAKRVSRVFEAIWHADNFYVVHFDRTMDEKERYDVIELCPLLNRTNVLHLPSMQLGWGGVTLVLNTIEAMEAVVQANVPFSHFLNVSPSDYPLVSPTQLRDILFQRLQITFGQFESLESYHTKGDRVERFVEHFYVDPAMYGVRGKIISTGKNPLSAQLVSTPNLVKGESWMILSRQAVQHIIRSTEAKEWLLQLAHVRAPDEWIFQNIVASNQVLASNAINDHLRFIRWTHENVRDDSPLEH